MTDEMNHFMAIPHPGASDICITLDAACCLFSWSGVKNSPIMFQNIMNELLGEFEWCLACIDDVLITWSIGDFEDHVSKINKVLNILSCRLRSEVVPFFETGMSKICLCPQRQALPRICPMKTCMFLAWMSNFGFKGFWWPFRRSCCVPFSRSPADQHEPVLGREQTQLPVLPDCCFRSCQGCFHLTLLSIVILQMQLLDSCCAEEACDHALAMSTINQHRALSPNAWQNC